MGSASPYKFELLVEKKVHTMGCEYEAFTTGMMLNKAQVHLSTCSFPSLPLLPPLPTTPHTNIKEATLRKLIPNATPQYMQTHPHAHTTHPYTTPTHTYIHTYTLTPTTPTHSLPLTPPTQCGTYVLAAPNLPLSSQPSWQMPQATRHTREALACLLPPPCNQTLQKR